MALIGTNPVSKRKMRASVAKSGDPESETMQDKQEGTKLFKSADGKPSPSAAASQQLIQCAYPGCTKTFKQLQYMKTHMSYHYSREDIICPV